MAEAVVVGVRVRPFNDREKNLQATVCIDMNGKTTTIKDAEGETKDFTFDESFWSHDGFKDGGNGYMEKDADSKYADQRFVFDTFGKRVLDNAWAGFHCCLFAYGQTGAGKSYSMVGYGANKGIVPISCEEIFKRIDGEGDSNRRYEVTVSMVEIYNETVQDLLIDPEARPKKGLEIRESKLLGIYIDGVIKRPVQDYAEIEATIDEATGNRTVGSTLMNATSSRAHTVQTIEFKQVEKSGSTEQTKVSMINLVDLAGSEKAGQTGAKGDRLKEGAMINKSLSALGNVIEKLAEKSSGKAGRDKNVVIPYRDSKLTRLLQNALGGSSKTIMICALSPASSNYEETLSTLRYADRAKKIKNTATINENPLDKLLRELKQENAALKEMMAKMQSGEGMDAKALSEVSHKQAELEEAQRAFDEMSKTFEQRQQEDLERQRKNKRKAHQQDMAPLLVNLNADPMLTGRTKYSLDVDKITSIGSHKKKSGYDAEDTDSDDSDSDEDEDEEEPDILLMHQSIYHRHATIRNTNNECYLQAPSESAPMTFVNGKSIAMLLTEKEASEAKTGILLQHGDRVVFGECYFFFADPSGQMAPEIMIATGQVDYAKAQFELFGSELSDSPWGKTPKQIVSVVKAMKVFAPLAKILDDVHEGQQQLEEEKARAHQLSEELQEIKPRKTLLENQLNMEKQELQRLKQQMTQLEEARTENEQLATRLEEEQEARVKLEKQLETLQTDLAERKPVEAELPEAKEDREKLEKELKDLKSEKEGLQSKMEAEVSEAKAKVQQEQDAKAKLLLLLQAKKPESDEASHELEELRAEKDRLSAENDRLSTQLQASTEKSDAVSQLEADLDEARKEFEMSRAEAARLQQELESARYELESTKVKLDEAAQKMEGTAADKSTADSMGVSFDQAIEALDLVERTLRELETKKKAPGAASDEYPMF